MKLANATFAKWATGFSGCDGGDIGSHQSRSIWFCGIEWSGGHPSDEHELDSIISENVELPPTGYSEWEHNLAYRFNWQGMKLFSVISGGSVSEYKNFAATVQPFTTGSNGYFKMNLYPLAFENTSHGLWKEGFSNVTGCESKQDYLLWIKGNRFPVMRDWVKNHSPKLIVCVGKSYLENFALAFADGNMIFIREAIDNYELNWGVNDIGTLVVVLPFMVNRNGLTKNTSIQKVGERICELMRSQIA